MAMSLDFLAGSIGGVSGVVVGHPFDTVKVRLQTHPGSSYSGMMNYFFKIIREESIFGLYKGLPPPLAGSAAINAITFGVQGIVYRKLEPGRFSMFLSGIVAGTVQSMVVSPIDLIKTRMQLQGQGKKYGHLLHSGGDKTLYYNNSWDCLRKIYKIEGFRNIYRGLFATVAREAPSFGMYFLSYEELCFQMANSQEDIHNLGAIYLFIAGGIAGSLSWVFSYPFDVVKTRIQADNTGKYKGMIDCFRQTYSSNGFKVFFRGLDTAIVRGFYVNAATLATFTIIKRNLQC